MNIQLSTCKDYTRFDHQIILFDPRTRLSAIGLSATDLQAAEKFFSDKANTIYQKYEEGKSLSLVKIDTAKAEFYYLEAARKAGNTLNKFLNAQKIQEASLCNASKKTRLTTAFAEGLVLSNYEFLKYKTRDSKAK